MVVFPNCKINLGLRITGKRADGYHNLETVFIPIPLRDALEILPASDANLSNPIAYRQSGNKIDGNDLDNICIKAYQLLKLDFPSLPPIQLHLHKEIPIGAGLGGGSADGAFTLKLLNEQFNLHLSTEQLIQYALKLGSDCPFFIINTPCYATGRGEILSPIVLNIAGYTIVVINPGIHINTGQAFTQLKKQIELSNHINNKNIPLIKDILLQDIYTWKTTLFNDFEFAAFGQFPVLKAIKATLYKQGAVYAAMSGSGSTMFGIFEASEKPIIEMPNNYFVNQLAFA